MKTLRGITEGHVRAAEGHVLIIKIGKMLFINKKNHPTLGIYMPSPPH